jgi:hypothetical protein
VPLLVWLLPGEAYPCPRAVTTLTSADTVHAFAALAATRLIEDHWLVHQKLVRDTRRHRANQIRANHYTLIPKARFHPASVTFIAVIK